MACSIFLFFYFVFNKLKNVLCSLTKLFNNNYHYINVDLFLQAGKDSGCTAVVCLLVKNKLYVANAGDSRCIISVNGEANDMSKDHKPTDESELKRILAAGGKVSSDGRINHGLNLSRSLGDNLFLII